MVATLCQMVNPFDHIIDRYVRASAEFEEKLRPVRSEQWTWSTPCTGWNVRDLVNHMTQGNRKYVRLLHGGTGAEFLRSIDVDPWARVWLAPTPVSVIHTWDLARAVDIDDTLDPDQVGWVDDHLDEIYAGLRETPASVDTTHRFFAAPDGVPAQDASRQGRLLHRMGRTPERGRLV